MKKIAAITAAALCTIACCKGTQEPQNTTIAKLQAATEAGKYMYAHQDDLCYGHAWKYEEGRSDVKDVCGDYPAIVGFDLGGIEKCDSANLDGVGFDYMRKAAESFAAQGGIVTFSWHLRNISTGGDAWDTSKYGVVGEILPEGPLHEEFMVWLSRVADFLESVKGPDGQPIPAIFRPWHENVANFFWWCNAHCPDDQFKALWAMTYEYMVTERGLTNLVWAYSPNYGITEEEYMSTYPGDEYVDILGLDAYHFGPAEGFIAKLDQHLTYLERLAQEHGKLAALTETGMEGIKEPAWWTEILDKAIGSHKICYALTWRNAWDRPDHFYGPWVGAECEEDFRAFHDLDNTLFLKDIQ